jgi:hypothetical protein
MISDHPDDDVVPNNLIYVLLHVVFSLVPFFMYTLSRLFTYLLILFITRLRAHV